MRIKVEYQDLQGHWRSYTTQNNQRNAYRTDLNRASATGKRHRIVSENGTLLDLIDL